MPKRMMDEWAKFCGTVAKAGSVVPIVRRQATCAALPGRTAGTRDVLFAN